MSVSKFGPLALKAVRQDMIQSGLARETINSRIVYLRTIFKWGVANEMVTETVYRALLTVSGLLRNALSDAGPNSSTSKEP